MTRRLLAPGLALVLGAGAARAQQHPVTRPELRIDATSARVPRLEGSAALVIPAGLYVRVALGAGAGAARVAGGTRSAYRADAIARFELDPLRQRARGPYVGGGLTLLARDGDRGRAYLALVGGVELKPRLGWSPALEIGLGGGARFAVTMRRAMESWR